MRPHESPRQLYLLTHMGRSEAPLSRDQREETPGRANRQTRNWPGCRRGSTLGKLGARRDCTLVGVLRSFAALSLSSMSKTPSVGQLNSDYSFFKISLEFHLISLGLASI